MDLLERAPLLEELSGVLAATAAGGRVILLAGEAGIGKSALVKRFTERQSAHARFLLGACDPLLTPRALGPVHDIARQTGGRLSEPLASAGPREAVFAAFLDQLTGSPRRQVVVVEDAHWADEATLDLLVFLGRRLERTPALLIVTYRDDELGAEHPLRRVLGACPSRWCTACGRSRCPRRPWPRPSTSSTPRRTHRPTSTTTSPPPSGRGSGRWRTSGPRASPVDPEQSHVLGAPPASMPRPRDRARRSTTALSRRHALIT
jgi:AAA ATPase domain